MDRRALARFRRNRGALIGLGIVLFIIVFSWLGPLLSPYGTTTPDFEHGAGPFGTPGAPNRFHWLGTDTIFRDLFTRLAQGGRLSIRVAVVSTTIAMGIGTAMGVLSGWYKGTRVRLDRLLDLLGLFGATTGALGVWALAAPAFGHRLVAFGAWSFLGGMLLRTLGRLLAVPGRLHALSSVDFLEVAILVGLAVAARRIGANVLDKDATFDLLVAVALGLLVLRATVARLRPSYATRDLPFLAIDFDDALMRLVDVLLSFPFLLLLMAISAGVERTSEATIFLVLGLTAWTGTARVIRGKTLQVRELEFVTASRALGQTTPRILLKHVVPNVAGITIILATNSVAAMIVAEAALSFLGLSVPPPSASWGRMLDEARPYYAAAPWLLVAPGLAILLSVLGFNLLGEGLRDAFDPKDV